MVTSSVVNMAASVWLIGIFSLFLGTALASDATGEFTILHSPKHVQFLHTNDAVDSYEIPAVIAAYLGLPLHSDIKWDGLAEGSPFHRPKAAVVVSINALPAGKLKVSHERKYPVLETVGVFDSEATISYIQSLEWKKEPMFVDLAIEASIVELKSQRPDLFSRLPLTLGRIYEDAMTGKDWFKADELGSLNMTSDADLQLAGELYTIKKIVNILKQHPKVLQNHSPDFFHFKINGLEALVSAYGIHSQQVKDALHLLKATAEQATEDFRNMYHDNCVVQLIAYQQTTEEGKSRKGRSLLATAVESAGNTTLNLAPEFTDMYPVIFNIILWTMIALALSLFAISWGIWNMDPGRDSLIYRMTSQRKKND